MQGALTGFAVILTVIAAGYIAARAGLVEGNNRLVLNRMAFFVASPALLFTIVARSDVGVLVSPVIGVSAVSAVIATACFVVLSRCMFPRDLATTTLAGAASGYANINNIGLPVGLYVIGEITYVPPLILLQVLIFAPIILVILESTRGSKRGFSLAFGRAATNPIIIGSLLGLVVALFGITPPEVVMAPLDMLGGAAIPMVLLAFGASFHGQELLKRGTGLREVFAASAIKSLLMPLIAWLIAGPVLGLDSHSVFAATVIAALPTAQNMYNYAATYQRSEIVVRNIVFLTTFASLPIILVITLLLKA